MNEGDHLKEKPKGNLYKQSLYMLNLITPELTYNHRLLIAKKGQF